MVAVSTSGIKAKSLDATPIYGTMSVPRTQDASQAVSGDDMDLGDPSSRIVAYEIPVRNWVEVIYV